MSKNLLTTILGAAMVLVGFSCFFFDIPKAFGISEFLVSQLLGIILFRSWMSKDKTLSFIEKLIK